MAGDLAQRAQEAERRESFEEAIELYRAALEESSDAPDTVDRPDIYVRVGDLYLRGGDREKAAEFYRRGAQEHTKQGLLSRAASLYRKVSRLLPNDLVSFRELARLHAELGAYPEAREYLQEYLRRARIVDRKEDAAEFALELMERFGDADLEEITADFIEGLRTVEPGGGEREEMFWNRDTQPAASEEETAESAGPEPEEDVPAPEPVGSHGEEMRGEETEGAGSTSGVGPPPPEPEGGALERGKAPGAEYVEPSRQPSAKATEGLSEEAELQRGLGILEEMLELNPDDLDLHWRRVDYARRLGDVLLRVESLVDLARAFRGAGSLCSAHATATYARSLDVDARGVDRELDAIASLHASRLGVSGRGGGRGFETRGGARSEARLSQMVWPELHRALSEVNWLEAAAYRLHGLDGTDGMSSTRAEASEILARYYLSKEEYEHMLEALEPALDHPEMENRAWANVTYLAGLAHLRLAHRSEAEQMFAEVASAEPGFKRVTERILPRFREGMTA